MFSIVQCCLQMVLILDEVLIHHPGHIIAKRVDLGLGIVAPRGGLGAGFMLWLTWFLGLA